MMEEKNAVSTGTFFIVGNDGVKTVKSEKLCGVTIKVVLNPFSAERAVDILRKYKPCKVMFAFNVTMKTYAFFHPQHYPAHWKVLQCCCEERDIELLPVCLQFASQTEERQWKLHTQGQYDTIFPSDLQHRIREHYADIVQLQQLPAYPDIVPARPRNEHGTGHTLLLFSSEGAESTKYWETYEVTIVVLMEQCSLKQATTLLERYKPGAVKFIFDGTMPCDTQILHHCCNLEDVVLLPIILQVQSEDPGRRVLRTFPCDAQNKIKEHYDYSYELQWPDPSPLASMPWLLALMLYFAACCFPKVAATWRTSSEQRDDNAPRYTAALCDGP